MANRYVRIYSGIRENTNIVGFSWSAADTPDSLAFQGFVQRHGYTTCGLRHGQEPQEVPPWSVSPRNVEFEPPLDIVDTRLLGALCIELIDPGHNAVLVIDNRGQVEVEPYSSGTLVARS